jgi:hypothetical protein
MLASGRNRTSSPCNHCLQVVVFTQYMRLVARRTRRLRVSNLRTQAADINQTIN